MTEKRLLALLGFLLGLVGGILLLADGIDAGRRTIDLAFLLERGAQLLVAVAILFGSLLVYRGTSGAGGAILVALGILAILLWDTTAGAVALVGGVLGLLGSGAIK